MLQPRCRRVRTAALTTDAGFASRFQDLGIHPECGSHSGDVRNVSGDHVQLRTTALLSYRRSRIHATASSEEDVGRSLLGRRHSSVRSSKGSENACEPTRRSLAATNQSRWRAPIAHNRFLSFARRWRRHSIEGLGKRNGCPTCPRGGYPLIEAVREAGVEEGLQGHRAGLDIP